MVAPARASLLKRRRRAAWPLAAAPHPACCPAPALPQITWALLQLARALCITPHFCEPAFASRPANHAAAYAAQCCKAAGIVPGVGAGRSREEICQEGARRAALGPQQAAAAAACLAAIPEQPRQLWRDGRLWLLLAVVAVAFARGVDTTEADEQGVQPDLALNFWASALHQLEDEGRVAAYGHQLAEAAAAAGAPEPPVGLAGLRWLCASRVAALGALLSKSAALALLDVRGNVMAGYLQRAVGELGGECGGVRLQRGAGLAASPEAAAAAAAAAAGVILRLQPGSPDAHLAAASAATPATGGPAPAEAVDHVRRALVLARSQRSLSSLVIGDNMLVAYAAQGEGVCPAAEALAAWEEGSAALRRCEEQLPGEWVAPLRKGRAAAEKLLRRLAAGAGPARGGAEATATSSQAGTAGKPPPPRTMWGALAAPAGGKALAPGQPTAAQVAANPHTFVQAAVAVSKCACCGKEGRYEKSPLKYCAACRGVQYCR